MEIIFIGLTAFIAAILTFFSGFGLGTLLTPVMMLFFPLDLAIALTGIVHFANNLFKLFLIGKHASKEVILRFGIPAILAALLGSWVLLEMTELKPLFSYSLFGQLFYIQPVKLVIAILLVFFSLADLIPSFKRIQFSKDKLPLGGLISGFFGGLSGHQGALRSAFLIRAGLSKEAFVGSAVVVSSAIDFTRLGVYATKFLNTSLNDQIPLLSVTILSAICGALIGNQLLKKITLHFVQNAVAVMLLMISIALGAGWI